MKLPNNWKIIAGLNTEQIVESQVNQELLKKVMQACNNLDDRTRYAVSCALNYAMEHAGDDDFIKEYGTISSNVLLGKTNE